MLGNDSLHESKRKKETQISLSLAIEQQYGVIQGGNGARIGRGRGASMVARREGRAGKIVHLDDQKEV